MVGPEKPLYGSGIANSRPNVHPQTEHIGA
jgi:hypothetical protein